MYLYATPRAGLYTVDREIFAVKNFRRRPFPTKIKHAKCFRVTLHTRVHILNIQPGDEN